MRCVAILSAILAVGTAVVSGATTCTDDVKVTEPTPSIPCDVIAGDLIVSDKVAGSVSIEGPKKITGNFDVTNATKIVGISSTSVKEVNGKFILNGCTLLSTADFQALQSIASINLVNLPQLQTLNFGTSGVTKVSNVLIVDTFMGNLDGFNVADADTIDISNNPKLNTFTSDLVTVTKSLKIVDNGKDMVIEMSKLESAGEIEFRRIKKATFDSLKNASSIKINDSPDLLTVSALNVTTIDASVSLINNKKLSNCSFPQVKTIKGDMTILNNTALVSMDCFPKLESVGNILVGGSMQNVTLGKLTDVKGSATVTSTTDISDFCNFFDKLKSDGKIRGKESCKSNNKNANSGDSTGGDSAGGNKTKEDAAGVIGVNTAMLGLVGFAGIAQLL
ncbi:ECM33-like protein [Purpureocillium lilacinum]|uniref:ECM33-like protein n=2 Tax=Purpureocillium lilacinum TaxID=33203 RepID=A0A179G9W6_PURLI|nr:ECM33-like protein [Purpureocillium lilacinum]OAQ74605.1 ECM33-like protein [Purpureocillium lilacinum]OAQ82711.1 ECM33-like protein [Purpureocillium lilacinum]GJN70945.1 hypothetical protein PLICBS_005005 [Purpureocillium lilacinum]GJN78952.1 hypothetical protein PLIIFM63780_002463 [Purpureocillium lilacinum]